MTLYVGAKLIKCDEQGKPVENEQYVLFEIVGLDFPQDTTEYAPRVQLKKLR